MTKRKKWTQGRGWVDISADEKPESNDKAEAVAEHKKIEAPVTKKAD